uniref:Secreted protein n=1 Tax=Ixodes ricinus TaxID=34613 RepID=A0A6B0V1B9_IXORI
MGTRRRKAFIFLVRPVHAVLLPVTPPGNGNALLAFAGELFFGAGLVAACDDILVRLVFAVVLVVALPPAGYAVAVLTPELRLRTCTLFASDFVRSVRAVCVGVAVPRQGYALVAGGALELTGRTVVGCVYCPTQLSHVEDDSDEEPRRRRRRAVPPYDAHCAGPRFDPTDALVSSTPPHPNPHAGHTVQT